MRFQSLVGPLLLFFTHAFERPLAGGFNSHKSTGCCVPLDVYETIARYPNRTTRRDLPDLVAKGIIIPLPGGGRTTRYGLAIAEPAQSGLLKK